jgi:hypothetical protein
MARPAFLVTAVIVGDACGRLHRAMRQFAHAARRSFSLLAEARDFQEISRSNN